MEQGVGQAGGPDHVQVFFKSLDGRYKRIRKRCKGAPNPAVYGLKAEQLAELERLSAAGALDLFYGDESRVCSEGYVPYGWQFPGEAVYVPVERGHKVNIWGLISRDNRLAWATTEGNIDAAFILGELEKFSLHLRKPTVLVLDNASVHKAKIIQDQRPFWEQRGLYLFYLPTYSPHLNLAEVLWRKMKKEQIDPLDYATKDTLFHAVNRCLTQLGNSWKINFSTFNAFSTN